jgi:hypothetical protein
VRKILRQVEEGGPRESMGKEWKEKEKVRGQIAR